MRTINLPRNCRVERIIWTGTEFVVGFLKTVSSKIKRPTPIEPDLYDEDEDEENEYYSETVSYMGLTNGTKTIVADRIRGSYDNYHSVILPNGDFGYYFGPVHESEEYDDRYAKTHDTRGGYRPANVHVPQMFMTWNKRMHRAPEKIFGKIVEKWKSADYYTSNDHVIAFTTHRNSLKWAHSHECRLVNIVVGPTKFKEISKMKNPNTKLFLLPRGSKECQVFELRKRINGVAISGDGLSVACLHSESVTILDLD